MQVIHQQLHIQIMYITSGVRDSRLKIEIQKNEECNKNYSTSVRTQSRGAPIYINTHTEHQLTH